MDTLLKPIDSFLNKIPMYRVVLYGLFVLASIAAILSVARQLPYGLVPLFVHILVILMSCFLTNTIASKIWKAPTNTESVYITGFILFFLLWPLITPVNIAITVGVSVIAMLSKYVLAVKKIHLFNPAACGLFCIGLMGFGNGIWWSGSLVLFPFVSIVGLLIVRKLRKFEYVATFVFTALFFISLRQLLRDIPLEETLKQVFFSSPLVFFATVMLTEPLTTPPTKKLQIMYGFIVGLFYSLEFHVGRFYSSPELALILGNLLFFFISKKQRAMLTLKEKILVGDDMYDMSFQSDAPLHFKPGQYLEWLLPHGAVDTRGNRRYFTIASSPTESDIKLGVKIPKEKKSSFKHALQDMKKGDSLIVSQYAGDFVLPEDKSQKLVFMSGGIGITPFRSMVKYLLDNREKRDIVLLYTATTLEGLMYKDLFDQAGTIGLRPMYSITKEANKPKNWKGKTGYITEELLTSEIPDYKERTFYISGPQALVTNYRLLLKKMGLPSDQIVTDYFPGF